MDFEGGFGGKKPMFRPIRLQLAAMIDVFTLIIVFMLKGAVFTTNNVEVPTDIRPPLSLSKETSEVAPQVFVTLAEVRFPMIERTVLKDSILNDEVTKTDLRNVLKDYHAKMDFTNKQAVINLNIVADVGVPYSYLFEVVKLAREAGYQSMLFVTLGEHKE